jgi:hypothetical protein
LRLDRLFSDTEVGKDAAKEIVGTDLTGDLAKGALGLA